MELHVSRLPDGSIDADAVLDIPSAGGRLIGVETGQRLSDKNAGNVTLLLYPSMEISSVKLNGRPVEWMRSGDQLRFSEALLDRKLSTQRLEISYAGSWNEWMMGSRGRESFLAFSQGDGVYLPASAGWYPLPGGDSLLAQDENGTLMDRPGSSLGTPISYDLTLEGFSSIFATLPPSRERRRFISAAKRGMELRSSEADSAL